MKILNINNALHFTYSICLFLVFALISSIYFFLFVSGKGFTYEPIQGYFFPVNIHDHSIYDNYIEKVRNADSLMELLPLNNNTGIALVYLAVINALALLDTDFSIEEVALLINLGVFFFSLFKL